jgi:secreted trypsin-like serine protease
MKSLRRVALLSCALAMVAAVLPAAAPAAGRITGGTKVDRAEFDARWQAIVSLRQSVEGEAVLGDDRPGWRDSHQCGGTLVRPDIVVTAAHCVDGGEWRVMLQARLRVLAGSRYLADGPKQPGQAVDVVGVRVHPSWKTITTPFDAPEGFDVAVLKLARPVTGVQPMALVGAGETSLWGNGSGMASGARVAGWGVTNALYSRVDIDEADQAQAELREVELPLLADSTCERTDLVMGADAELFDRDTMLCGHARDTDPRPMRSNRKGTCYGDSGGPLAVTGADGAPRLVGIVSWGPSQSGGCQLPSVFTRVDGARDWIEGAIADLDAPSPLQAATLTSGDVVGADTLRVRWSAAPGSPVRYTIVREAPLYTARELDELSVDEDEPLTPAARRWLLSQRLLVPMTSTGRDSREAFVRGIPPHRSSQRGTVRLRIEARDDAGRMSRSAALVVSSPTDDRAPGRPLLRQARANGFAMVEDEGDDMPDPSITWRAVRDNDCVDHYVVQVAGRGGRWRHIEDHDAEDCPSDFSAFLPSFLDDDDDDSVAGATFTAAVPGVSRGAHLIRLGAVDRAGNVAWGRAARIVVRPTADGAVCVTSVDGSGGCSW